jgi:hypothetical protein
MALGSLFFAAVASIAAPPYTVVRSSTGTVGVEEEVGDLLVVDGKVEVRGVVRGFIYAVGSEVIARSTAVILKPISMKGGTLRLEDGAVLPGEIELNGARLYQPGGRLAAQPGARSSFRYGDTAVNVKDEPIDPAKLTLMKAVLPFDRFMPASEIRFEDLAEWHPGLGLNLKKDEASPKDLVVGGVARLTFSSDKVKGARQRGYRGARGTVLMTSVELADDEAARTLWKQIAAIPEDRVTLSVRSGLGDGAHWFFRHRSRYCMLWQRGRWFFAVETRLGADAPSIAQEVQFSEQVLTALRNALEQVEQVKR